MNKILVIFGLLALAALDWAALHDILKKNESNYVAEWMVVIASAVIFTACAIQFIRKRSALIEQAIPPAACCLFDS